MDDRSLFSNGVVVVVVEAVEVAKSSMKKSSLAMLRVRKAAVAVCGSVFNIIPLLQ